MLSNEEKLIITANRSLRNRGTTTAPRVAAQTPVWPAAVIIIPTIPARKIFLIFIFFIVTQTIVCLQSGPRKDIMGEVDRLNLLTFFILLSSIFFAGCALQKNEPVSPVSPIDSSSTPLPTPAPTVSPTATVNPASDQSSLDQDSGLPSVQGDQINEGEEIVQ